MLNHIRIWTVRTLELILLYLYYGWDLYMSHGTIILFNISLFKLSGLSPSWVLNVSEILESLIRAASGIYAALFITEFSQRFFICFTTVYTRVSRKMWALQEWTNCLQFMKGINCLQPLNCQLFGEILHFCQFWDMFWK